MPTPSSTTTTENIAVSDPKQQQQQQRRRICFSFAAYAKSVINHLKFFGVPITAGLSDLELTAIESSLHFNFPPDLRSFLCEGLPIGAGFPNWRSSSPHQLQILLSFPITGIINEISKDNFNFWPESFGIRPSNTKECVTKARSILSKAPVLVPIYRNFYIPSFPVLNGNPVFYIRSGWLKCSALDLADFFQRFKPNGAEAMGTTTAAEGVVVSMPAWAAKSARRVEVWTELVDEVAEGGRDTWRERRVREMGWRLREGGWREEEVWEMMDGEDEGRAVDRMVLKDRDSVMWHVRLLALALLRSGWSTEDVVYCMGSPAEEGERMMKRNG